VNRFQVSAQPPAKKTACQIEKETKVLKIPNLKHQIANKSQYSMTKTALNVGRAGHRAHRISYYKF
jgi:enoyl-[acyl-carrier-protein] reductase (NADH)